jgi:hypothetical protein
MKMMMGVPEKIAQNVWVCILALSVQSLWFVGAGVVLHAAISVFLTVTGDPLLLFFLREALFPKRLEP